MTNGGAPRGIFSEDFDDTFSVGDPPGNSAFFGLNVLQGLVDGIDDFIHLRQKRWRRWRPIGPALLASSMWIDDDKLIDKIGELSAACVVVTKQERNPRKLQKLQPLAELNKRTPGMPILAFSELTGLAPKEDGQPAVVGPYSHGVGQGSIPTIRTLGFRKTNNYLVPALHAKLALLGQLWWHDEDGSPAGVADVIGFEAKRLWISSANFTESSRRNLEFGYWTEDPMLIEGVRRFLVKLMRSSEALDPDSDVFDPELAPVEFDDEAIWQALGDSMPDDFAPDYLE